jgi:hypothetical protein
MLNNDPLLPSLAKVRQEQLWDEAQRMRLILEFKRHRPGFRQRLTSKVGGLTIALGRRLKARQERIPAMKAR